MTAAHLSSGDLIADRRYEYARAYAAEGDTAAAADLFAQALELAPDFLPALIGLADAERDRGDTAAAEAALRRALPLDEDGLHGAALRLAALGAAPVPAAPPAAYVRGLFDAYADRFESALLDDLDYRTPDRLAALLPDRRFARALDLGCGTGLMGAAVRDRTDRLEGVDLSPAMIAEASAKGLYDALAVGDVTAHLQALEGSADLILAADVLVYLGDLAPVLAAAAARLAPGGLLAVSVEAAEAPDAYVLRDSLRYAHGETYLRDRLHAAGLRILTLNTEPLRLDRGTPVIGHLAVAART